MRLRRLGLCVDFATARWHLGGLVYLPARRLPGQILRIVSLYFWIVSFNGLSSCSRILCSKMSADSRCSSMNAPLWQLLPIPCVRVDPSTSFHIFTSMTNVDLLLQVYSPPFGLLARSVTSRVRPLLRFLFRILVLWLGGAEQAFLFPDVGSLLLVPA